MATIDCFLIGHNEFSISRARRLLLYLYGRQSHEYKDRIKYNLSQVTVERERYSPVELFNHVRRQPGDASGDLDIITESFNLAIAYLGSHLSQHGLTFDFVNSFQAEKDTLRERLLTDDIRTIGVVTTYYLSHQPIHDIISFIRKYNTNVRIIVGGPYVINKATSMDDDRLAELFQAIGADYYVRDPAGEDILVELINSIREGTTPTNIRNLYYRDGDTFRLSYTRAKPYNFAENRIDWPLFGGRLAPVLNLRTAVSCPYKCAFCNYPLYAGNYVLSPLEYCEAEMRVIKAMGVRHIQFVDDTFNVPEKRFKALLRMMIANKFDFRWNSYYKCQYADRETVELMKESGCEFVFLGIESGSQTILDNMDKHNRVEVYRNCLRLFEEYDIMTMCSVIVGYPGETTATFEETVSFIEDNRPTFYQQRLWWYDRTAPVHHLRETFGLQGQGYSWRHATMDAATAHDLADHMFLNIRNSIHITEYALPFFLLARGMSKQNVKRFLASYMDANREQYVKPNVATDARYVERLVAAAAAGGVTSRRAVAH
jgi:anaerobic magnesium-protoporphyrin IX monomethyl ester cyclase